MPRKKERENRVGELKPKVQGSAFKERAGGDGGHGEKGHRCTEVLLHLLQRKEHLEKLRLYLGLAGVFLLTLSLFGLLVLASSERLSGPILAYISGLSMALLPSALPALLIIIPLTVRRGYRKGAVMAALFGAGLATTQAMYGVLDALSGQILYLDKVTLGMWGLAGTIAYHRGLVGLALLKGRSRFPPWQTWEDHPLAFSLGLLLGNAGQSCPNPAFYTILDGIASGGNPLSGAILGFLHGIGRATLLIGLTLVVLIAPSAGGWWRRRGQQIEGWLWVGLATLLIPKAFLGQEWWEESSPHHYWNRFISLALGPGLAESGSIQGMLGYTPHSSFWSLYGPWLVVLILGGIPVILGQGRKPSENAFTGGGLP